MTSIVPVGPAPVSRLDVTVVIACHSDERWRSILDAAASVKGQEPGAAALVIAVDHNASLAGRLTTALPDANVVLNDTKHHGASATRNIGVQVAVTPLVAFLDDDEVAREGWLNALLEPFEDASVVGTGGRYDPLWHADEPPWFPSEFGWVVGSSYTGMPTTTARVRNVWSGNMAVRTDRFREVGGFRLGFGKLAGRSRPEDTDLCIRMASGVGGGHWIYVPHAVILHDVPKDRSSLRFFVERCYAEGRGKIEMQQGLKGTPALDSERDYLRRTLPHGVVRHVASGRSGFARAAVIGLGVAAAGAGAVVATVASAVITRQSRSAVALEAGG